MYDIKYGHFDLFFELCSHNNIFLFCITLFREGHRTKKALIYRITKKIINNPLMGLYGIPNIHLPGDSIVFCEYMKYISIFYNKI